MLADTQPIHSQADIFDAMALPDFYPHAVDGIEQRDTVISKVFLTGKYAYKIKKPVDFEYLDFTTLKSRRHYCKQEVALNRRLAPNVYLAVVPITFLNGRYRLNGDGTPIEYTVVMRQLPDHLSMRNRMHAGEVTDKALELLAGKLALFHQKGATGDDIDRYGSWQTIRANIEENFRQIEPFVGDIIDERKFQIVRAVTRAFLIRHKTLFDRRVQTAKIRDCHGDLRSEHIYFSDGPQIIDCIEFNDRFRYSDVTADLAFLSMDIDFEGHPEVSQRLIDAYAACTKDRELYVLLDFYKCYRAFVRIKINCFRLRQKDCAQQERHRIIRKAGRYLNLSFQYAILFSRPTIWVVCGLPATGKSTVAKALAELLNIKWLRSDVIRKELFGLKPSQSRVESFGHGIYSKEAGHHTYANMLLRAQNEIEKGRSVVIDASFARQHYRDGVLRLAMDMDTNIIFVECAAPHHVIKKRLELRETSNGQSDARKQHLKDFRKEFEPLTDMQDKLHIRIDTNRPFNESMRQILSTEHLSVSQQIDELIKKRLSETL